MIYYCRWGKVTLQEERRRRLASSSSSSPLPHLSQSRLRLLGLLCLVFGIEIGYKFASRTAVHLLFPCHLITVCWIWFLSSRRPSNLV